MNKFIDRLVNITQNDYEPPIVDEYWKFNIYSISKEILGDNKFIVIKMYIKPSYTLNSTEQKDTVVNGNYIAFKLLVN